MNMSNQTFIRQIPFYWLLIFVISICACTGLEPDPFRPELGDPLATELRQEYQSFNLYVPPDTAFILKNVASDRYAFWDRGHLRPNSNEICGTCAGEALNTADEKYSDIALLDWDRHQERYTTNLGIYADDVVDELAVIGWDTLFWAWPPKISSAWRNPARNDSIPDSDPNSLHMFGRAIDFDGENGTQLDILKIAVQNAGGTPTEEDYPTGWIHSSWPPH